MKRCCLQQTLSLSKICSLFKDEEEERISQDLLDRLSQKKISWDDLEDPLALSRLAASRDLRTLLHLAVIGNRLDIVDLLKDDPLLKSRRDHVGLSPIDVAKLLGRKEALFLLEPSADHLLIPEYPLLDSFEYLSHPIFETEDSLDEVIATIAKAKEEDKIPSEKIWMGIYFDKEIRKGIHPSVQIRYIDNEVGFGVFAMKKIPPCTFVGEYSGVILQRSPRQLKEKNHCLRYTIWEGKKNYCIDAEEKGNFTRFINHSATPNLGLQSVYWRGIPRMIFISLKEIGEGSQLTFDYGPIFWKYHAQIPKKLF